MIDENHTIQIITGLKELLSIIIGTSSGNEQNPPNDILSIFFFSMFMLALLTSIKFHLARYRCKLSQNKINKKKKNMEFPQTISFEGVPNDVEDGGLSEADEIRLELMRSRETIQRTRKKSRKELENEFEELTTIQRKLKSDLNDLKGLLSTVQNLTVPNQRQDKKYQ